MSGCRIAKLATLCSWASDGGLGSAMQLVIRPYVPVAGEEVKKGKKREISTQ